MNADKPSHLVPKLRFPEFRDAPDWEKVSLGTLLFRPPDYGVNAAALPFSETLPTYIRITDIDSDGQFAPCPRVSVDIGADEEQYLKDGDIVLARTGASVGKSYRYRKEDGRLVYAGFLIRVRPHSQRLLSQFLAAYLSTWSYWDWVRLTSARSGQPGINGAEYASMPLPLPPNGRALAEQRKISDCLGSLDDLIAAEGRKLETLRQHKQGLMQQLFPQPGETVPRLRFPEFAQGPRWDHAKVADLVETVTPPKKLTTSTYLADGRFPIIDQSQSYICGWTNDDEAVITRPLPVIVFGDHTCVLKFVDQPFAQGADGIKILTAGRRVSTVYLYHQLTYRPVVMEEYKRHFSTLKDKVVYFPDPKSGEQKKIADCLTSIDDQLNAQARKLETLKQHKRGLLQQLFPKLETA